MKITINFYDGCLERTLAIPLGTYLAPLIVPIVSLILTIFVVVVLVMYIMYRRREAAAAHPKPLTHKEWLDKLNRENHEAWLKSLNGETHEEWLKKFAQTKHELQRQMHHMFPQKQYSPNELE